MKRIRKLLLRMFLIFALGMHLPVFARADKDIDLLIQKHLPNASIGILVLDAAHGNILYERHAKEFFPPASNTKLFTAAAGLLSLGTEYRFETRVLVEERGVQLGKLNGNLYLRFEGDPSLSLMDFKKCISKLKSANIEHIKGNIVIDGSRFQAPEYGPGWNWDNLAWYYAAPVTAIMVDQNQIPLTFTSNPKLGKKVTVGFAVDEGVRIPIKSTVITVSEAEANKRCQLLVKMDPKNALTLGGCWPSNVTPSTLKFALHDPFEMVKQILLETLKAEKIQFEGKIIKGSAPTSLKTLSLHQSKPLRELLIPVLQDSNNIYTESLLKTIGYKRFSRGTFQLGIEAMKEILTKQSGFDFTELHLVDGSGLSTNNWVTPEHLAQLLLMMHRNEQMAKVFKSALPAAGRSQGTLKNRLQASELQDRIQAKTGTLLGVSTLSGYLTSDEGKELIMVIMIDHILDKEKAKNFENELCKVFMGLKVANAH